jgi:ADP-dependent NAD(P)H-hydrate dehydratase / NAD(P)H-hydrate epimerase
MANPRIPAITQKQVASFLHPRPHDSHKGQFGTVAVIGGNKGMVGAALLAGRASLKLGAGCVHVGLLAEHAPVVDMQQPELMLHTAQAALKLPKLDVIAIGCGMGHDLVAQKLLHDALKTAVPLILDADALNMLAMRPDLRSLLGTRKAPSLITPHPGEAARLLGIASEGVQAARPASAQELAKRLNCSVVLKGAGSLCVSREGKMWINNTGNPGMSSAGMGDVLSGMIAAFIAQGLDADNAMLLAVHLHGAAGDTLADQQASIGMTASEVGEWSRWLLNQWLK